MGIDIKGSLELLNHYLKQVGEQRSFVICGGASLVLQGIQGRGTADIDIVGPAIDEVIKDASVSVARALSLSPNWLNDDVHKIFSKDLPLDWELRVFEVYSNSHLVVQSLSKFDLAILKFLAECDRQKDFQDLLDLELSELEIDEVAKHALTRNPGIENWAELVAAVKRRLKLRMRYEKI